MITPISFPSIDSLDIKDSVIAKCKAVYETWGKTRVYDTLDNALYYNPKNPLINRTLRYLYLYRQAFIQTKCFVLNSDEFDLREYATYDVDPTTHCKYCGRPLHICSVIQPQPDRSVTLTKTLTQEEYDSVARIIITIPVDSYGDYFDRYTFYFTVNGVERQGTEAVIDKTNKTVSFIKPAFTISTEEEPFDNQIIIYSTDQNEIISDEMVVGDNTFSGYCNNMNCYSSMKFNKRSKWSFINFNATVPQYSSKDVGYVSKSGFTLDDYEYDYQYSKTELTMKKRGGGKGAPRSFRFDFEYKYAINTVKDRHSRTPITEFVNTFKTIAYSTFRKCFFSTISQGITMILTEEELLTIYQLINELPLDMKEKIVKFVHNYMTFDRECGRKETLTASETAEKERLVQEIVDIHEAIMLPLEFTSYLMCTMILPRHVVILSDTEGGIGSKLLSTTKSFFPVDISTIAISKMNTGVNKKTTVSKNIVKTLDASSGIDLYDNYYIMVDDEFNFDVYSFFNNSWLENDCVLLENKPSSVTEDTSSLIKLISFTLGNSSCIGILTVNNLHICDLSADSWGNSINISSIPESNFFKDVMYDEEFSRFVFITDTGLFSTNGSLSEEISMISEFSVEVRAEIPNELSEDDEDDSSEIEVEEDNYLYDEESQDLMTSFSSVYKCDSILEKNSDNESVACPIYMVTDENGRLQIIKFVSSNVKVLVTLSYGDSSPVINAIDVESAHKIFVIYENQRIVELNTYMYTPFVLQDSIAGDEKILVASKVIDTFINYITYITTENNNKEVYSVYEKNVDRTGNGKIKDVGFLITEGSKVASYDELYIYPTELNITVFPYLRLYSLEQKEKHMSKR